MSTISRGKNDVEMTALVDGDSNSHQEEESEDHQMPPMSRSDTRKEAYDSTLFAHIRVLLYTSHLLAQFSEIAWQFSVALFLAAATHYQSLILVSTYGLVTALAVCLVGPFVGRSLDMSTHRLSAARKLIWTENLSVVLATLCCFWMLSQSNNVQLEWTDESSQDSSYSDWSKRIQKHFIGVPMDISSILCLVAIHILGALAQIMDRAFLVAIERDWVVVLARAAANAAAVAANNDKVVEATSEKANKMESDFSSDAESFFGSWLSQTNVAMKQIDLGCKVAGPAIAGFFIPLLSETNDQNPSGKDLRWACIVVGLLNVLALVVEYVCTAKIYALVPLLSNKKSSITENESQFRSDDSHEIHERNCNPSTKNENAMWAMFRLYFHQPIAWGGLGLALLYMNAMTFGNGIMTAYLLFRGIKLEAVGVLRGIASAIGLLGTLVYTKMSSRGMALEFIATISIIYQFLCLLISWLSLAIESTRLSLMLLIGGVSLSRIGLWTYDISITQLQQEKIPDHCRGTVGGVQESLNAFFTFVSFSIGIFCPNPEDFFVFVAAGGISVGMAVLLVVGGLYIPNRNHL